MIKEFDDSISLNSIKMAFFDIDGVLSVPSYFRDGRFTPGGNKEWWDDFTKNNEDAYIDCKAPKVLKDFLTFLEEQGIFLYILSTEDNTDAIEAKRKFIKREYYNIKFEDYIFVEDDCLKVPILKTFAASKGLKNSELYFLDDTFNLVLEASDKGFNSHHISEFLINNKGINYI